MSDKQLISILKKSNGIDFSDYTPELNEWYLTEEGNIEQGKYALVRDIALPKTGELLAKRGTLVEVTAPEPYDSILGHTVFKVKHLKTQQEIIITQEDITR